MSQTVVPRFGSHYRQDEISLVCRHALSGESLCFVGVAGTGKSNMLKYLRDDRENKRQYLGDAVDRVHFPMVDTTVWEGTPLSLWRLMLDALETLLAPLSPPPLGSRPGPRTEEGQVMGCIEQRLTWACQELGQQVMFLFDDFDRAFVSGPLSMLEQLNRLRGGNRERLSYCVFTRKLPHILGREHNLAGQCKFYDLLRHNIYALGLYTEEDARLMLRHLNAVAGAPLSRTQLRQIEELAGGHARLLKVLFDLWAATPPPAIDTTAYLASQPDVEQECRRILDGLHRHEQEVARRLARGTATGEDQAVVDHLARRGLLVRGSGIRWFSPLFERFLRRQ